MRKMIIETRTSNVRLREESETGNHSLFRHHHHNHFASRSSERKDRERENKYLE